MITLFGATGFTGRKTAAALHNAGLPFRIAGRSAEKLAALSQALPNHPEWITADAENPSTLPSLVADTPLLINLAGPYTDIGERVLLQAALSGTHYLDVSNELGFVFRGQAHHKMALRTGAVLVPANGFEVALADCLAELAGRSLPGGKHEPIDRLDIIYVLNGVRSSAGTRRSAVRSLATSWIAYRDGDWRGMLPSGQVQQFALPSGNQWAMLFPSCESITTPAHLPVRHVDCWMGVEPRARFLMPLAVPLLARLSRSILRPWILSVAARGASAETAQTASPAAQQPFLVYARAARGSAQRWISITGNDPYTLTADVLTYTSKVLLEKTRSGGLYAPAQVIDPEQFLDHGKIHWGWTVEKGGAL